MINKIDDIENISTRDYCLNIKINKERLLNNLLNLYKKFQ